MLPDAPKPDGLELRLGYPTTTDDDTARTAATAEWVHACAREGVTPAGEPTTTIERDDPGHQAMGQFVVIVTGEVTDGPV